MTESSFFPPYLDWCRSEVDLIWIVEESSYSNTLHWDEKFLTLGDANQLVLIILSQEITIKQLRGINGHMVTLFSSGVKTML